MGDGDWLAREENVFLASGLCDGAELSMAWVDATEKGRGTWGCSVAFQPTAQPQMLRVAEGVTIPVYTAGVLRAITILPERRAASWFTSASVEVNRMRTEVQSAIRLLFGDDNKADAFIGAVEAANEEIRERGLVTREDKPVEEPAKTEEAPKAEAPAPVEDKPVEEAREAPAAEAEQAPAAPTQEIPQELVLDESALAAIAAAVKGVVPAVDLSPVTAQLQAFGARLEKLERSEDQKRREWQADLPAKRQVVVTSRPRVTQAPEGEQPAPQAKQSLSDKAAATLARMPKQRQ